MAAFLPRCTRGVLAKITGHRFSKGNASDSSDDEPPPGEADAMMAVSSKRSAKVDAEQEALRKVLRRYDLEADTHEEVARANTARALEAGRSGQAGLQRGLLRSVAEERHNAQLKRQKANAIRARVQGSTMAVDDAVTAASLQRLDRQTTKAVQEQAKRYNKYGDLEDDDAEDAKLDLQDMSQSIVEGAGAQGWAAAAGGLVDPDDEVEAMLREQQAALAAESLAEAPVPPSGGALSERRQPPGSRGNEAAPAAADARLERLMNALDM